MDFSQKQDLNVKGEVLSGAGAMFEMALKNIWKFECFDKRGNFKWTDYIENLVVNEGLNDVLDKYLKGSGYTAAHYAGLTNGTPDFSGEDTLTTHTGWTEVTAYSGEVRRTATWGAVSGQSVDNSSNKAVFTINSNSTTIGGAFITPDSVKGGSGEILYGGGAFSAGDKLLDTDDVLNVTITATVAAS